MAAYLIRQNVRIAVKGDTVQEWEGKRGTIVHVPDWVEQDRYFKLLKQDGTVTMAESIAREKPENVFMAPPKRSKKLDAPVF